MDIFGFISYRIVYIPSIDWTEELLGSSHCHYPSIATCTSLERRIGNPLPCRYEPYATVYNYRGISNYTVINCEILIGSWLVAIYNSYNFMPHKCHHYILCLCMLSFKFVCPCHMQCSLYSIPVFSASVLYDHDCLLEIQSTLQYVSSGDHVLLSLNRFEVHIISIRVFSLQFLLNFM